MIDLLYLYPFLSAKGLFFLVCCVAVCAFISSLIDVLHCSQVCREWNKNPVAEGLWRDKLLESYPGIFTFSLHLLSLSLISNRLCTDRFVDNSMTWLANYRRNVIADRNMSQGVSFISCNLLLTCSNNRKMPDAHTTPTSLS
jgi:hypothetical protein